MAIRGSLREASLPDVLQLLAMGNKSGTLSLTVPGSGGTICFENGRICHATIYGRNLGTEDSVFLMFKWNDGFFSWAYQADCAGRLARLPRVALTRTAPTVVTSVFARIQFFTPIPMSRIAALHASGVHQPPKRKAER